MLSIARITISVLFVSLLAVVFTASSPSVCAQFDCDDYLTVEVPEIPQELMCGVASQCTLRYFAQACTGHDPETVEVYSIGPYGFPTTPMVELEKNRCATHQWYYEDPCADPTWSAEEEVYFISDYGLQDPDELSAATIEWVHCTW